MRKHGILLTVILAVLLVVLCIGAMELSDIFLSDYQNTVEEISLSENQSMLMINNREADTLYPWDIYERTNSQSVISTEYEYLYPDNEIERIIEIFSPWVLNGYEAIEWNKHMKYTDTGGNLIFYIKDVQITDEIGDTYLVNIALTYGSLLYYSCDRINIETIDSDVIASAYDKLNKDYSMFLDLCKYGDIWNNSGAIAVDGNTISDKLEMGNNCFVFFLDKLNALEYADAEWGALSSELTGIQFEYTNLLVSMIGDATSLGMIYRHSDNTPNVVNVEFSNSDINLVFFYDLSTNSITGLSFKEINMQNK